ncbi:hypothetical protein EDB81DRAFT_792818 [Dactylonectria macrodidyma]|uniref:Uncharacterized protein n=1 Tax=Dactylonectria macrodidyma TaxID=307937 RepID=A0A9P9J8X4_9HYPO|nr:hypothetical protein EDB81DRAFT_792818 [Dactylonectria macrodidyma]
MYLQNLRIPIHSSTAIWVPRYLSFRFRPYVFFGTSPLRPLLDLAPPLLLVPFTLWALGPLLLCSSGGDIPSYNPKVLGTLPSSCSGTRYLACPRLRPLGHLLDECPRQLSRPLVHCPHAAHALHRYPGSSLTGTSQPAAFPTACPPPDGPRAMYLPAP